MLTELIFQLCGLQTFAAPRRPPLASSLAVLWCIANVLAYAAALAFCFGERRWLFADRRSRGLNLIPFIRSTITILAHLAVLAEALLARNGYRAFDERLGRVDRALGELSACAGRDLRQADRRYRTKLLLFVTFCCATELAILGMVHVDRVEQAVWCLTVPSLVVIRLRHLQHAHHIDRLAARFATLRQQLEALCSGDAPAVVLDDKWLPGDSLRAGRVPLTAWLKGSGQHTGVEPVGSNQSQRFQRMHLIKATYLALWHAAKDLNGCCVYAQLANLLQNFIQCTCDLYSMYSLLYLNQFEHIFGFILSVIVTFVALGIVLAACENCKNEVGQMGQLLHKRHGDEGDLLAKMVENLSLLLQHTPVYFSLGGFFDMDFILLKEMVAAITTYMVIFIQFMPKDESSMMVDSVASSAATIGPPTTTTTRGTLTQ